MKYWISSDEMENVIEQSQYWSRIHWMSWLLPIAMKLDFRLRGTRVFGRVDWNNRKTETILHTLHFISYLKEK